MEARKITVVPTKEQEPKVILTEAETLGELKRDLRVLGIKCEGMTFYEGITKTELFVDSALLPRDVPYKDKITNELVFLMTNVNKKIASGMDNNLDRTSIYAIIKKNNLGEECIHRFGKNFTNCRTEELFELLNEYLDKAADTVNTISNTLEEEAQESQEPIVRCVCEECNFHKGFFKLLDILEEDGVITEYNIERIEKAIKEEPDEDENNNLKSSYTREDIDNLLNFA